MRRWRGQFGGLLQLPRNERKLPYVFRRLITCFPRPTKHSRRRYTHATSPDRRVVSRRRRGEQRATRRRFEKESKQNSEDDASCHR